MKKIQLVLVGLMLFSFQFSNAQSFGINASIFQPNGDFNENTDKRPAGISMNYLRDVGESNFSIGGELGVAMYANKEYDIQDHNNETITIYEEDCFWTAHAIAQYKVHQTPNTIVYGEGRMGATTFFSSKMAEEEDTSFDDEFKFHGTAFNTGFGGGVKLNLSGIWKGDGTTYNQIWLDMGTTVNSGSRASYRNASDDTKSLDEANYTSLTNYINYRIGIRFQL